MANTGLAQLPANLQGYYDRRLLERVNNLIVHDKFAQMRSLPANNGTKVNFRRYNNIAPATTPLTEGVTPSGSSLSSVEISATIQQYGDFVTLTDQLNMHGLDNIVAEATDICADAMAETQDLVIRDGIVPNITNKIFIANDEASTLETDIITVEAFRLASLDLKTQNAKPFTPFVDATDKVGTSAIRPSFWAIAAPEIIYDLEGQSGYVPAENYASTKTLMEGEVGAVVNAGIRIIETNAAYKNVDGGNLNVDTYHTSVYAKDAYGVVRCEKGNGKVIVKPLGSGNDPIDQRSTVGYKFSSVAKILNDSFLCSIVSAASTGDNA